MVETRRIAEMLRQVTEAGDLPGIAAAAANADGVIFQGGFGTRDLATGAAMTADTVVWIASMTKAITSACAMQLVERGRLSLDGDIAQMLPELASLQVLDGFDAAGKPQLRAAKRPLTLRHLLTHTSGHVYDIWNAEMVRYMAATGTPGVISCQNAALATPLMADPGERWEYGISIDWVGKAVEAASGQTLDHYMQHNIFLPLGMADTGFKISQAQRSRLARIHMRTPSGLAAIELEVPQAPEFHMGGGGLYSTAIDYLKFTQMIMFGGRFNGVQVLAPETVATMSRHAMGELRCRPLKTALPASSHDMAFIDGMQWGLSFLINPEPLPTGRSSGSLAWAGLANTYYWIDPTRQLTGVYTAQVLPCFDPQAMQGFEAFETAIYDAA